MSKIKLSTLMNYEENVYECAQVGVVGIGGEMMGLWGLSFS